MVATLGELLDIVKDLPRETKIVRGDNSGGYEDIYEIVKTEIKDNFDDKKTQMAIAID